MAEIKEKLERLNDYDANEKSDVREIRAILHEIAGQMKGNVKLNQSLADLIPRFENLASVPKLSEPKKRSLIHETREKLRNLKINNLNDILGS